MEDNILENVLFFKGRGNPNLSLRIMTQLKEYAGHRPIINHINFGRFGDGELDDNFEKYGKIKGKTLVFFECLEEEKVMLRFLQLCWAAKHQYGAKRIIAFLFFMHYRRQERENKPGEIWRNRWLAQQIKISGIDHVILPTPHSEQIGVNLRREGIEFTDIDLSGFFANCLKPFLPKLNKNISVFVYAPDEGSIIRAIGMAKKLECRVLFSLKNRGFDNEIKLVKADQEKIKRTKQQYSFFPELKYATLEMVKDAIIFMIEDEIDSGSTANSQAVQLRKYGASKIYLVATHAVCTDPWRRKLFGEENPFSQVIVSDTIDRGEGKRTGGKIHDEPIAKEMASELFRVLNDIE